MTDSWRPTADVQSLRFRAELLRKIRQWFFERNVLEVETPLLSTGATTDPHIESFQVAGRVLRTSSEFHQKRLLAAGIGDNYELGKVFRIDESGRYHNPEFTMLEWYRCGIDHHQLITEVEALLTCLHGPAFPGFAKVNFRDLWQDAAGIDIASADISALLHCFSERGIEVPAHMMSDFDGLLDLGMATFVVQSLAANSYTCVYHYPASQASLARIAGRDTDYPYACRFEVFFGQVELANGYYELTSAQEQQSRFEADNRSREAKGLTPMPLDNRLIAALEHGLPDCAGVALGIDRLMMILMHDVQHLSETLSFDWKNA